MGKIKNLAGKWAKIKKWAKLDGQNFAPDNSPNANSPKRTKTDLKSRKLT